MQYVQDYDEKFPNSDQSISALGISAVPGGVWYTDTIYWPQILHPYHKSLQVFVCPSASKSNRELFYGTYGISEVISPRPPGVPRSLAAIPFPAGTYLMADYGIYIMRSYRAWNPLTWNEYLPGVGKIDSANTTTCNGMGYAELRSDCLNGRHFDGVNVAYADGHVKWTKSATLYNDAKNSSSTGGWNPTS